MFQRFLLILIELDFSLRLLEEVTLEGMEIEPVELRMACLDLLDIFPNLKIHGLDLFLEEEEMKESSE